MSEERNKRVWPWIVAVLVVLPVLYVASFGPACWLYNWKGVGQSTIPIAYYPILWLSERGHLIDVTYRYATCGRCPAMFPAIGEDGQVVWAVDLPVREK